MRIDKVLWFLRIAKTRTLAQAWVAEGHIRCNGVRIERAHHPVKPGDVVTVPVHGHVMVLELLTLPARRGPALEAQSCYRRLDAKPADS